MSSPSATLNDPGSPDPAPAVPATLADLMVQALAIEIEAAERYGELADAMETHNNTEVAALFRRMQEIEGRHADSIRAEMGWDAARAPVPATARAGHEAPETAAHDDVHYLMQPYHALEIALAAEEGAERFFSELARMAPEGSVREAARLLADEEREHVRLVREWMSKVPAPEADWASDPDPPRYFD